MKKEIVNIIGLKVGRLEVLEKEENASKISHVNKKTGKIYYKIAYKCKCECGKIVIIRKDNLIGNKKTYSCGCLQKEAARKIGKATKKPHGEVPLNLVFQNYKRRAKSLNKEFTISREEFIKISQKPCYYCDNLPSNKAVNSKIEQKDDIFIYNGLDRIDSNLGYIISNIVPCCADCNYAKSDLTTAQFYDMIRRIYEKHIKC